MNYCKTVANIPIDVSIPKLYCVSSVSPMWCSDCQEDFATIKDAEIQVCPRCQSAAKVGRVRRRVPKLNPRESKPKLRFDSAHLARNGNDRPEAERELMSKAGAWLGIRSLNHLAVFGLLIFLLGQSVLAWAFLVGNYVAWSVANLISVVGITISVIAISITMRNFERRVQQLAKLVGRRRRESGKRNTIEPVGKK